MSIKPEHSPSPAEVQARAGFHPEERKTPRPTLLEDRSFRAITATQFLGAFNDNLFKQIILLLFVAVPSRGSSVDLQWLATLAFSLPFIFFSGYAGYLSDRFSKRRVILLSKVAEVGVMLLGLVLFTCYVAAGMNRTLVGLFAAALFLMGAQSAFFGPGKYGVLPELFRRRDLPAANGVILMTTFLAIILGSALAGVLMHYYSHRLWLSGSVCVGIAVLGCCTALGIRGTPPAQPAIRLRASNLTIPGDIWDLLIRDPALRNILLVSTLFWLAAALVQMAVNALGELQLGVDKRWTSLLVSTISLGIAAGSLIAGTLSRGRFRIGLVKTGAWGLIGCLLLLALPGMGDRPHVLGYWGCMLTLVVLGAFTGIFAVPIQVFLQARPPAELKGRMIATQNLLNWVGITLSALVYFLSDLARKRFGLPNSSIFNAAVILMLWLVLILRRPDEDH